MAQRTKFKLLCSVIAGPPEAEPGIEPLSVG
jgi:hypothetical protein